MLLAAEEVEEEDHENCIGLEASPAVLPRLEERRGREGTGEAERVVAASPKVREGMGGGRMGSKEEDTVATEVDPLRAGGAGKLSIAVREE